MVLFSLSKPTFLSQETLFFRLKPYFYQILKFYREILLNFWMPPKLTWSFYIKILKAKCIRALNSYLTPQEVATENFSFDIIIASFASA